MTRKYDLQSTKTIAQANATEHVLERHTKVRGVKIGQIRPKRGQRFPLDGVHDRLRECIDLEIISNGAS